MRDRVPFVGRGRGDGLLLVDQVEQSVRSEASSYGGGGKVKLPEERALAVKLGVSRKTVRAALQRLKRDNLIFSVRGKGTFLVPPPAPSVRTETNTVHLICRAYNHPLGLMSSAVISGVLTEHAHTSNLVISEDPLADWESIVNARPDACGAVIVGPHPRSMIEALAQKCTLPLVLVGDLDESIRGPAPCDNVLGDNGAMAYRAVDWLIRQGHRRIGLLGSGMTKVWSQEMRRGWRDALEVHDIAPSDDWVVDLPPRWAWRQGDVNSHHVEVSAATRAQVQRWQENPALAPTAAVCPIASEIQVRDLLQYQLGNVIAPENVVGLTFQEMLPLAYTGLSDATAVCMRFEDIARRAIELLLRPRSTAAEPAPPTREIQERVYICQRIDGVWKSDPSGRAPQTLAPSE